MYQADAERVRQARALLATKLREFPREEDLKSSELNPLEVEASIAVLIEDQGGLRWIASRGRKSLFKEPNGVQPVQICYLSSELYFFREDVEDLLASRPLGIRGYRGHSADHGYRH